MKIVRYTSNIYDRHVFAIRMRNTSNSLSDHYVLSANLNSAEKEYKEPPDLFPNINNLQEINISLLARNRLLNIASISLLPIS
jgi:hypothetical protein